MAHKGDIYKGYPANFNHTNAETIMTSLKSRSSMRDIAVTSEGLKISFGVRVKIYPYPENIMSVWTMFTVRTQYSFSKT